MKYVTVGICRHFLDHGRYGLKFCYHISILLNVKKNTTCWPSTFGRFLCLKISLLIRYDQNSFPSIFWMICVKFSLDYHGFWKGLPCWTNPWRCVMTKARQWIADNKACYNMVVNEHENNSALIQVMAWSRRHGVTWNIDDPVHWWVTKLQYENIY